MRPDPLAHLHSPPPFPSWPFAVAHPDFATCVLLLGVAVAGIAWLLAAVAFTFGAFRLFYGLDRFFIGEVYGIRRPRTDDPPDPNWTGPIEAVTLATHRRAADLARSAPHAPEPPPASATWPRLVPLADLWFERVVEADGEKKRTVTTPRARALFNAWADATGAKPSDAHHVERTALFKDYQRFAFDVLENYRDEWAAMLPSRDFWPLVRERFGVRDTTYGPDARWNNRNRTVPLFCSTVAPKYDNTPAVLRATAAQAMAEARPTALTPEPSPIARPRKRL